MMGKNPNLEDATWMKKITLLMMMLALLLPMMALAEDASQAIVYFDDGSMVMLPAEIAHDPVRLSEYCATYFPGRGYSFDAAAGDYDAVLSEEWTVSQYGEGSRAVGVLLKQAGIAESVVTLQGSENTVPTRYLTFGENTDGKHRIGVVYAPRTGEASMREEEGSNTKVVCKAQTGRIAAVLQYDGGTYTKILYDGEEGYIRTDCLIFFTGEEAPIGTGTIHIKGATDGAKTVTLRSTASTSQAKVTALKTGTVVNVYEKTGDWYAVESDGWYGYVQAQYLTME